MSVKKRFNEATNKCRVTFTASKAVVGNAEKVYLVGDFNSWDCTRNPMKKQKNGSFKLTLELGMDWEYQYKFLIDGEKWENDDKAEKYIESPYTDSYNCIVFCYKIKKNLV